MFYNKSQATVPRANLPGNPLVKGLGYILLGIGVHFSELNISSLYDGVYKPLG